MHQTPIERKLNRPSHGQLWTWAVWCGPMRRQAQVVEEGLEQPHEPCGLEGVSETPGATSDGNLPIIGSIVDQLRRQLPPTALDQLVALLTAAGDRQSVARGEGGGNIWGPSPRTTCSHARFFVRSRMKQDSGGPGWPTNKTRNHHGT